MANNRVHRRGTVATAAAAGTAVLAVGAMIAAALLRRARPAPGEHRAPDLAADRPHPGPQHRAPEAFRPDPTAVPSADEREALRPATGPAPSFAADRGSTLATPVDAA